MIRVIIPINTVINRTLTDTTVNDEPFKVIISP